jgi:glycosyltransferase involved in cell wall biosynthesis
VQPPDCCIQFDSVESGELVRAFQNLPGDWQLSVAKRASFIQNSLGLEKSADLDSFWFQKIEQISSAPKGLYFCWVAITGCYPTKIQFREFESDFQIHGLKRAAQGLIAERSKSVELAKLLASLELVHPKKSQLVDVTHTFSAPYLTGIQRVVFGVTADVPEISTFIWIGTMGLLQEKTLSMRSQSGSRNADGTWRIRLIHSLHSLVPRIERTPFGKSLRKSLLPAARRLKRNLVKGEIVAQLNNNAGDSVWTNLFIFNCEITIPEIPSLTEHISAYECLLEESVLPIQIILYDFIPFFHAWTVQPGNRGHLNSYVRLVLLANKVVAISKLVEEQAKLITQAFRLERSEWEKRPQEFAYLNLPSGLEPGYEGEFVKEPNLIVMAGSIEPRKNHLQFLDALEILSKRGIDVKGELLGSAGWENDHILNRIHDLQSKGINVKRVGNLSDSELRARIGKAQALLQISEAEGFGLPIAEALSLGTRVVVSDIRPLKEWKSDRVEVISMNDAKGLAEKITKIIENPEKATLGTQSFASWSSWTDLLYR